MSLSATTGGSRSIVFLPIVDWDFRQQRPQQLARCFARAGWSVYYAALRPSRDPAPPTLLEPGVWRLELTGDPDFDPYQMPLSAEQARVAANSLGSLSVAFHGCWVAAQLPAWRSLAEELRRSFEGRLWFDCMDEFAGFADHADLAAEEAALARTADLVTATSQRLREKLEPISRRFLLVGNGCDPQHFGPALARGEPGRWPVIGFFGGVHEWFDAELLAEVALRRPAWRIWLVGDTYQGDVECLRTLANVCFLGEVEYAELPSVVSRFDVGIIPFKHNPLTAATDPVKAYEMLAAGLPVVAVDLPQLHRLRPHVALANDATEFIDAVERALRSGVEERRARFELAQRESWVERFVVLRRAMDEAEPALSPPSGPPSPPERAPPGRFSAQQSALLEAENARLLETARRLHSQAESLIEQRDVVAAEGARVAAELVRVEAERVILERRVAAFEKSRWWRLGALVRRQRRRREPTGLSDIE